VKYDEETNTLTVEPNALLFFELEVEATMDDGTGKILESKQKIKVG
jgi:hypothetical protein